MSETPLYLALRRLAAGDSLSALETHDAVTDLLDGNAPEAAAGAFLTALRMKGETAQELLGAVRAIRELMIAFDADRAGGDCLDTCGTGGDGADTVNAGVGDDFSAGGAGADLLHGSDGGDVLDGESGNDTFVFKNGTGNDLIVDFEPSAILDLGRHDLIDIRDFHFADFDAVMNAATEVGDGVFITLDADDAIFVQGVTKAQFAADDFLLT